MVKCEKLKSGFMISLDGDSESLVKEIAYAAAAYHVNVMQATSLDKRDEETVRNAIKASCDLFGMFMAEAMERILNMEHRESELDRLCSLVKKEGGAVQ